MKQAKPFSAIASNINLLWASLFIEELIRHGITEFCIAPGSRSTPLTLAVANHEKANAHLHFDERGLGFLALGMSQASQKPVVIITTSGSAAANLYPAVIEARQSNIPLIIISADRPATLIDCGANQAIEQHGIFANYPLFFAQIIQPSCEIKANYLLTTIDAGLNKQRNQPAPIHFNIAFAEPLYPTQQTQDYQQYLSSLKKWPQNALPFTQYTNPQMSALPECAPLIDKKIIVVLGKMTSQKQAVAVAQFCHNNTIPLLADIQSLPTANSHALHYYDLLLINPQFQKLLQQADLIVQFGEQLISKRLTTFMADFSGELQLVKTGESRIDPNHQLDKRFNCEAIDWLEAQTYRTSTINKSWFEQLQHCHDTLSKQIITPFIASQPFSEIGVIEQLGKQLPAQSPLFIGNSMPIRIADMLMHHHDSIVYSNRGASGIDGLLASAIGVAKQSAQTTTLLIGDSSFLYDLNSLALLSQLATRFIIIVINNDGGAIFNLLPVPHKQKQRFYQLPHGLNFKASCEQFCIDYYTPNQVNDFKEVYNQCLAKHHSLIEINVANQQTASQLEQLKELIHNATL